MCIIAADRAGGWQRPYVPLDKKKVGEVIRDFGIFWSKKVTWTPP